MGESFSVISSRVDDFECLRQAVHGSHVDITQLERGRLSGSLTHVSVGNFSLSVGTFSVGIRAQRTSSDSKLIIGMLLGSEKRVTHWSYDMHMGDVLVIPPKVDHDGTFHGGASYAALRLDLDDVADIFRGEARLSDPETWRDRNHFRADPRIGAVAVQKLRRIVSRLAEPGTALSSEAADFWRRSIIDAVTATAVRALPSDTSGPQPSAIRLVRNVEHYVDIAGSRPVHISEICAEFGVSRRSLHRAFDETLGVGPVSFLRQKRLCNIHSVLRDSDPAQTTVTEVAMQHGFIELGRFSQYYRALFAEYPSQTLRAQSGRGTTASRPMFWPDLARLEA